MKMSVREARANFAAALEAAEKGEHVTITKNGKPVAELGPPRAEPPQEDFWARNERARRELGLDKLPPLPEGWEEDFNDPAWTEELFGDYFRKIDNEP